MRHLTILIPLFATQTVIAQTTVPQIIPQPRHLELGSGSLALGSTFSVTTTPNGDGELARLGEFAAGLLTSTPRDPSNSVPLRLTLIQTLAAAPEAYTLTVSPASIDISAATHAGIFYGLQTLVQLIPRAKGVSLPALTIEDAPRFQYRGMMLDVGRHFFPVEFVKRYIDLLAMYKMNTFHWHLTEDQGWRIEIKRYPRLTEVGAYRAETIVERNFDPYIGDGVPHGGFYTQDEVRDIVAYAEDRFVTVIPEIEMPGHSLAALAAYPEFACTEGPFEVGTIWGVQEDIYCPKEETFAFLENVLDEVMDLFPSRYIHVGGDEAPKTRWEESPIAQEVIRREGLADEHELQSYFIRRIERYLNAHGRRLIGWDEILEGGLAPQATVMSWRGMDGGIAAAQQGHDVIMAPNASVYFDHYQSEDRTFEPLAIGGFTPLHEVYEYEPIPEELTEQEAQYVLGVQGQLWTEYIKTSEHAEYMLLPRMVALSEVAWSPVEQRDWSSFLTRLPGHFTRLDELGYTYRVPDVEMRIEGEGRRTQSEELTLDDHMSVSISAPIEGEIRYSTDPALPFRAWPTYTSPLDLQVDTGAVTVTARLVLAGGKRGATRSATFRQATPRPAEALDDDAVVPGLAYEYFEAELRSVNQISGVTASSGGTAMGVGLQGVERDEQFGLAFTGFFRAEADGIYRFSLTSDDGSRFWLANTFMLDNDGLHGSVTRSGTVALARGLHPVHIRYFQAGGGQEFRFTYSVNGGDAQPVDGVVFRRRD